jgi:aspartate/glutamate racemase
MNTDCVVLGCTELSLILNPSEKILDPMEILAKKIINTYRNKSKL